MEKQKTLKGTISIEGIGLHSATPVRLIIQPAPEDTGIIFRRVDIDPGLDVHAVSANVSDPNNHAGRQTTLAKGKSRFQTIEHLLASLHAFGIDNAIIEIDNLELPALDGSARTYAEEIQKTGICEQARLKDVLVIEEPIYVDNGRSTTVVLPAPDFQISYTLSYNHPALADQYVHFVIDQDTFSKELAPARTFCLKEEAEALRSAGYGKGANSTNTLVFENNKPIDNTLRFCDEAARHKVVDLIGDLYLLGCPIRGHIITARTGHAQNLQLVKKLTELRATKRGKKMSAQEKISLDEIRNLKQLDIMHILRVLPHRYPFLLVDRILDLDPGKRIVAIKNVTINEPFFHGHFEGHPIMPGVLIVEAMAQAGGIVTMMREEKPEEKVAYFMSIEKAKFRAPVRPGDQMRFEVDVIKSKGPIGVCACKAFVEEKVVCEAEVMFTIMNR
jgi:UDP-3-O-[3-hydroxymyristoyl] N-acetylglucosamine deacetylase / 3-hydroxyacyl-[acyl-carrier-protein] dehydratase